MKNDTLFAGPIAQLYEKHLVPLIFEPYAKDIAERLAKDPPARILEIAAGTGVVTRAMDARLPPAVEITATDLNQPMLDEAMTIGTKRRVTWQQADAMKLPFGDAAFDAVVCQFGVMFFPDRSAAYAEARRVLRPGGRFIFNAWDRLEENEFAFVVTEALATVFPDNPIRFMARVPHGYFDRATISADLRRGGFDRAADIEAVTHRSRASSPLIPAIAICQGTPTRNEIEARDASRLEEATRVSADALAKRFGRGAVDGKIQAIVVSAVK